MTVVRFRAPVVVGQDGGFVVPPGIAEAVELASPPHLNEIARINSDALPKPRD